MPNEYLSPLLPVELWYAMVRMRARLHVPLDGDSWYMLLDHRSNKFRAGATVHHVRLRDYSAREKHQPEEYNDQHELVRLSGEAAAQVALDLLQNAVDITLAINGDSFGRDLAWLWLDGRSFGKELELRQAVKYGAFVGLKPKQRDLA